MEHYRPAVATILMSRTGGVRGGVARYGRHGDGERRVSRDDDTLMRGADVQSPAERKQRERWRKNNNILPSGPVDLEPQTRDLYLRIGLLPVGKASDKSATGRL